MRSSPCARARGPARYELPIVGLSFASSRAAGAQLCQICRFCLPPRRRERENVHRRCRRVRQRRQRMTAYDGGGAGFDSSATATAPVIWLSPQPQQQPPSLRPPWFATSTSTLAATAAIDASVSSPPPMPPPSCTTADFYVEVVSTAIELMSLGPCLVGNLLVLVAFARYRKLRTRTNALIANLAFADLIVGLFVVPYNAVSAFAPDSVRVEYVCLAMNACFLLTLGGSLNSMLLISLDRCCAIAFPFFYVERLSGGGALVCSTVCFMWATLAVIALVPLLCDHAWNESCTFAAIYPDAYKIATSVAAACEVAANAALYLFVARVALRQQQRVSVGSSSGGGGGSSVGGIGGNGPAAVASPMSGGSRATRRRDLTAARSMLVTNGLFIVCWSPYITIIILIGIDCCGCDVCGNIYRLAVSLGVLNSGINGLVYSWRKKDFNLAVRRLLRVDARSRRKSSKISVFATSAVVGGVTAVAVQLPSPAGGGVVKLTARLRSRNKKVDDAAYPS